MKNLLPKLTLFMCLFMANSLWSQTSDPLSSTYYSNFKCEVYLEIYNGMYDWYGGNDYSGKGIPLSDGDKTAIGAVTVANKNDTDGDGIVDLDDTDVRPGSSTLGRNEIDLIKVVIKKVNEGSSLSGNVIFKINSGNVKIWTHPWKGTEITTLPYTFTASQLDKTLYLEALDASSYQGIEMEVVYNGNSDHAKATSIWVTRNQYWRDNTSDPVPGKNGTLTTLESLTLSSRINNLLISTNGNRYGHGDFNSGKLGNDNGAYDKRFGGRILFEFQVSPNESARLVNFDITRQRKTRTGKNFYGESTGFEPSILNTDFPNDPSQNKDNESPNDDNDSGDEDNTPNFSFIYSVDPPGTKKNTALVYKSNGLLADTLVAFIVSRNSFKEFVRMQVKSTSFPFITEDKVRGSRASDLTEWHCSYYARRFDSDVILSGDNNLVSASIPLKFNKSYTGNGTVTIALSNDAISDNFFLSYAETGNEWFLANTIGEGAFSGVPAPNGTWTVTFNGVTAVVTLGSVNFEDNFTWVFNTFKSIFPSKSNEIDLGPIEPTTGF